MIRPAGARAALLVFSLTVGACRCGALDPDSHFACTTDAECGPGFRCASVGDATECISEATGGGGGATGGGATGGGATGGGATGGGATGGGATGGGATGGGATGGGATGGGATGGGAPGGGATGGGATGGGATGGGATGGGATGGGATGGGATGGGATGGGATGGGVTGGGATGGGVTGGGGGVTGGGGGATGGGTATGGGATGGGATGDGGTGGPTKLKFTTPSRTAYLNGCSAAVTVGTFNAADVATPPGAAISVSWSALGQAGIYSDAQCSVLAMTSTLSPATPTATVYFSPIFVGSLTLTATSPALQLAQQPETASLPPDTLAIVGLPTSAVAAGTCTPFSVETRSSLAGASPVALDSLVMLSTPVTTALSYFSDAACTVSIPGVTILAGASSAQAYVKGISGSGNPGHSILASVTVQSASLAVMGNLRVNGAVRRGTCTIPAMMGGSVTCSISPAHLDLAHTLLFFQAIGTANTAPIQAETMCQLSGVGSVLCARPGFSGVDISIAWQTVELVSGLSVQRKLDGTGCWPATGAPLTQVDPARSFALSSSIGGTGSNFDATAMPAIELVDGGVVVMQPNTCSASEFQVAEMTGVNVLRGAAPGFVMGNRSVAVTGLTPASTNSVVLTQSSLAGVVPASNTSMCNLFARGFLESPAALRFTRGATINTGCDAATTGPTYWQRVDFGARARVQQVLVTMVNGQNSQNVAVASVDTTRTVAFAGSMVNSGIGTGETAFDNNGNDIVADGLATFELTNSTTVRVTRSRAQAVAQFTMYVVEFVP